MLTRPGMHDLSDVASLVEIQPEATVSRTVLQAEGARVVLFHARPAGAGLSLGCARSSEEQSQVSVARRSASEMAQAALTRPI